MERRFISGKEVRIETREDGTPVVHGYASVFYDGTPGTEYVLWDDQYGRAVERIMPGAFDATLAKPADVRGLFNHDPNQVLGRNRSGTMRLGTDETGLKYDIDLGKSAVAQTVAENIDRGDVSGSSFSFGVSTAGQRWTATGDENGRVNEVREILEVSQLYDVGPVTFPAYEGTTAGMRAVGGVEEARAARDKWRAEREQYEPMIEVKKVKTEILKKRLDSPNIAG